MKDHDTEMEESEVETDVGDSAFFDDGDFEYDENGDIIIPESVDEEGGNGAEADNADESGDADDDTDEDQGASEESDNADTEGTSATVEDNASAEPESKAEDDAKDRRIAELEARYRRLEAQSKDTLKKLGVDTDDAYGGLIKLAAEADDKTPEEYKAIRAAAEHEAETKLALQKSEFEKKIQADLDEVHAAFPETAKYKSVREFPHFEEFGRYRDAGLPPKKAFLASHEDEIRGSVASAARQKSLNDTKNHLQSAVPKGSKDDSVKMTRKELSEWRDIFPEKSDKEIMALYRKTKN